MKMIKRMMETKAGRVLKRLFGEETGAVLMEYVILAVMIAAACVVAVIYFGRTANKQIESGALNMSGKTTEGAAKSQEAQSTASEGASAAETHNKAFHDKGGN